MSLHIAVDLALPIELVTQSVGVYGIKGSGKTFAAKVFAEECIRAGVQVVAIDPTDAWWGLRSAADGTEAGLPVYVFGGEHGDVPLEATAGELLADVIVDHGISAVLSLRHLRKADQHRFVTAFAERLYHRKGEAAHRTPLHLFIDEAHSFAPQQVQGETARMVGAIEDLVRLGRGSGIGCTLISQRPASVNNNVRTQCETLICLRILAPHDRKALESWIEAHDSEGQGKDFLASLASLRTGEAWVWSPPLDLFQRVQIRRLCTFDSSATPKPGETRVEPERLASVDLDVLRERMAETIERAKADDPKALRATIARLQRELAERGADAASDALNEQLVAELRGDRDDLRRIVDDYGRLFGSTLGLLDDIAEGVSGAAAETRAALAGLAPLHAVPRVSKGVAPHAPVAQSVERSESRVASAARGDAGSSPARSTNDAGALTAYQRSLLTAVAQRHPAGSSASQIAMLSRKSKRSSSFAPALRALVDGEFVHRGGTDQYGITTKGFEELGGYEAPPTGRALAEWWLGRVSAAEAAFLRALLETYPLHMTKEELAAATGRSLTSSAFMPPLRDLVNRELAVRVGEMWRAAELFFEGSAE